MILIWVGPTEGVIFKKIAKNGVKLENWISQKYRNRYPGFHICLTLYIVLKIQTKKIQKK